MNKTYRFVSPPSCCTEAALHLFNRRRIYEEKSDDEFALQIALAEKDNSAPFKAPGKLFGCRVRQDIFEDMQTLYINEKDDAGQPVLFYLHGGAFLYKPGRLQLRMIAVLAKRTGAAAVVPIYPKLPSGSACGTLEALSRFYRDGSVSGKGDVIFVGDSAGGTLALGLALKLRDEKRILPKGLILFSPWLDLELSSPGINKIEKYDPVLSPWGLKKLGVMWAGGSEHIKEPCCSPFYGDYEGFPHIAVFAGTHDILYPEERAFCRRLEKEGRIVDFYTYRRMDHVFACYLTPEGMHARAKAANEIKNLAFNNKK